MADSDDMEDNNPSTPADLHDDGILWMLNRTVFHPRGFAAGFDPVTGNFQIFGDGTESWNYAESMEQAENERFRAFEALLERARVANGQ